MNTEIKSKWVKALKSKKYKQGKGALKSYLNGKELHCCLGVLCDLYIKDCKDCNEDEAQVWLDPLPNSKKNRLIPLLNDEKECSVAIPPDEVFDWADIPIKFNVDGARVPNWHENGEYGYVEKEGRVRFDPSGLTSKTKKKVLAITGREPKNYNLSHLNDNGMSFNDIADVIAEVL